MHVEIAAGIVALVSVVVSLVALGVLHVLPTGLSPLHNAVSQYGITSYRLGYRIQTIAMGISAIAVAIGISRLAIGSKALIVVILVIFGVARLAISWFPMDTPGSAISETGRRHGSLAIVAFACATLAALRLGATLGNAGIWHRPREVIDGIGIEMLVVLVLMGFSRRHAGLRQYFGLVERAFYAGTVAFLFVVAIQLVRA